VPDDTTLQPVPPALGKLLVMFAGACLGMQAIGLGIAQLIADEGIMRCATACPAA